MASRRTPTRWRSSTARSRFTARSHSAAHMNMTVDGEIDGSARATANLDRTSAGWPKNGPTSHFHRVAAGHGGQPGQWGQGTMTARSSRCAGSSGNGARLIGGAALKIEAQELVLDGVISMDGGHGLSVNNGNNGGGGSGGSVPIRAGVLKGSGAAVLTVRGGGICRGDGRWDGPCGGGGGRVALYCNSTEMEGSLRGPRTAGDQDARRPRKREAHGRERRRTCRAATRRPRFTSTMRTSARVWRRTSSTTA